MSAMINSVLTNQFFLMFLAIATGLLIGKIKIGVFHWEFPVVSYRYCDRLFCNKMGSHSRRGTEVLQYSENGSFLQVWLHRLSLLSFCCFFLFPSE